jgi:nucleoside 2-deoxyribosyltransferase
MKIYVGARYTRKYEARGLAETLVRNGFEVTATWFYEPDSSTVQLDEVEKTTLIAYAKRDIEEINAADVFVLMSDGPREKHPRGGKHVEFGYALGKGKPVIVYGPIENIFHLLRDVIVTDKDFQLLAILGSIATNLGDARYTQRPAGARVVSRTAGGEFRPGMNFEPGKATEVRVVDPVTGGAKGDKPCRIDLIPPEVLWTLGLVYGMGAKKYEPYNWLRGYKWSLSIAALFRHLVAFVKGEYLDDESGLPHLAHCAWHCATLMEFNRLRKGTDDRQTTIERKG